MRDQSRQRALRTATVVVVVLALAGCTSLSRPPGSATKPSITTKASDPMTVPTLLRVATEFNNDFGTNHDAPVYARWDARSQAIISGAEFVRRHKQCATSPQAPAHVQTAAPGPGGAWLVRYSIGGQEFTDYWYYRHGRWVFDLILSNPQAVKLYRLSGAAYARAVGCNH